METDQAASEEEQIAALERKIVETERRLEQVQRKVRETSFGGLQNNLPWLLGALAGGLTSALIVVVIWLFGRR